MKTHLKAVFIVASVFVALAAGTVSAIQPAEEVEALRAQFTPTKPTVVVRYGLEYRFKSIRLIRIAEAVVSTTEGTWRYKDSGKQVPVFFMETSMDTYDTAEGKRKRISFHDKMVSVLTNPDLKALVYMRAADQYMNPLLSRKRSVKHMKLYNLESGSMDYYYEDYLRDVTNNVLGSSADLLKQGREVAELMKLMSSVYLKEQPLVDFTNSPAIYVDIENEVRPFVAQTRFADAPISMPCGRTGALKVEVRTPPESKGKQGRLLIWVTSLRELASKTTDKELVKVADESPNWSIVPLTFEYDLMIGCLYGVFKQIKVADIETVASVPAVTTIASGPDAASDDSVTLSPAR